MNESFSLQLAPTPGFREPVCRFFLLSTRWRGPGSEMLTLAKTDLELSRFDVEGKNGQKGEKAKDRKARGAMSFACTETFSWPRRSCVSEVPRDAKRHCRCITCGCKWAWDWAWVTFHTFSLSTLIGCGRCRAWARQNESAASPPLLPPRRQKRKTQTRDICNLGNVKGLGDAEVAPWPDTGRAFLAPKSGREAHCWCSFCRCDSNADQCNARAVAACARSRLAVPCLSCVFYGRIACTLYRALYGVGGGACYGARGFIWSYAPSVSYPVQSRPILSYPDLLHAWMSKAAHTRGCCALCGAETLSWLEGSFQWIGWLAAIIHLQGSGCVRACVPEAKDTFHRTKKKKKGRRESR
jgi:hypothetical protein